MNPEMQAIITELVSVGILILLMIALAINAIIIAPFFLAFLTELHPKKIVGLLVVGSFEIACLGGIVYLARLIGEVMRMR